MRTAVHWPSLIFSLALTGAACITAPPVAMADDAPSLLNCNFTGNGMSQFLQLKDGQFPGDETAASFVPGTSRSQMDSPFATIRIRDVQVYAMSSTSCDAVESAPETILVRLRISAQNTGAYRPREGYPPLVIHNAKVLCGLYAPGASMSHPANLKLDTMTFDFFFGDIRVGEAGLSVPFLGQVATDLADGAVSITRGPTSPSSIKPGAELATVEGGIRYKIVAPGDKQGKDFPQWVPDDKAYEFGKGNTIRAKVKALAGGSAGNIPKSIQMAFRNPALARSPVTSDAVFSGGSEQAADPLSSFTPGGQATSSFFVKQAHLGGCSVRIDV
jgi:hypothetical protein